MTRLSFLFVASLGAAPSAIAQLPNFTAPPGQTVWNTAFTQVVPTVGAPFNVAGGVFVLDTVTIPAGSTLRGVGPNPMLILCNNIQVDGTLDVSGTNGLLVNTLDAANFAKQGGVPGPAGGNGGDGSPNSSGQSWAGNPGRGPLQVFGGGGGGGLYSLFQSCDRGSGGGGGAFATKGDPNYKQPAGLGTSFPQRLGYGGFGCLGASGALTRTLTGGTPGARSVVDTLPDNDFFGLGFDVFSQQIVVGELTQLTGGGGGGGGGNKSDDHVFLSPAFQFDASGGGGGGGGGCIVIAAQNTIVVGPLGKIVANGGHGGGGEQAGSCNEGGGGGGGAGGLLILVARGTIDLHVKGETYANNDYDFVLSADGGVCLTGTFGGGPTIAGKYPQNGVLPLPGAQYDSRPLGGFGGMGAVQLMTFAGNNADGTNTVLDDNVRLFSNGVLLNGATKQRYLAWRGYRNPQGVLVDDFGVPTNVGNNEGDIRPSPALLPIF